MKFVIILLSILVAFSSSNVILKSPQITTQKPTTPIPTYNKWLLANNKKFDDLNNFVRNEFQRNWEENVRLINEIKMLNLSFKLGVNAFTHLNPDEFVERYCGAEFPANYQPLKPMLMGPIKNKLNNYTLRTLPDEFDWRDYVDMQPVLNQKKCGSCWAFATTALLGGL